MNDHMLYGYIYIYIYILRLALLHHSCLHLDIYWNILYEYFAKKTNSITSEMTKLWVFEA